MMTDGYKDKYFSILGDSISTLAGYNPPECGVFYDWQNKRLADILAPEDTWWGKVLEELGGKLLVNHSWAGSTVCKLPGHEIESYGCSDARTGALDWDGRKPDVVMVAIGLNDHGWRMPLSTEGEKMTSFPLAYSMMLEKIRRNYPEAEIWCLTFPHIPYAAERAAGYHAAIYACAEKAGCRIIDIYRADIVDTLDNLHPTRRGMQTIAGLVLEAVAKR